MTARLADRFPLARWAALDRFFQQGYGPRYALRDQALVRWHYGIDDDPAALSIFWYGSEDEVFAILGYRPARMFWGGLAEPVTGAWVTNWMTLPEHRAGAGAALMRRAQELFPVVVAQGASVLNKPVATLLGFRIQEPIGRMIAVFDPARAARFLAPDAGVTLARSALAPAGAPPVDGLPADYAPDWRRYPAAMRFGTVRDRAHLAWRYLAHPRFAYRLACRAAAAGPIVCVWRLEQSVGDVEDLVGRIVEFFHPAGAEAEAAALLTAVLAEIERAGAAFADFLCSAPDFTATAGRAGMIEATALPIAFRLSPTERRLRIQNVEWWAAPGHAAPADLADWYVTKGDGDQDRPNNP